LAVGSKSEADALDPIRRLDALSALTKPRAAAADGNAGPATLTRRLQRVLYGGMSEAGGPHFKAAQRALEEALAAAAPPSLPSAASPDGAADRAAAGEGQVGTEVEAIDDDDERSDDGEGDDGEGDNVEGGDGGGGGDDKVGHHPSSGGGSGGGSGGQVDLVELKRRAVAAKRRAAAMQSLQGNHPDLGDRNHGGFALVHLFAPPAGLMADQHGGGGACFAAQSIGGGGSGPAESVGAYAVVGPVIGGSDCGFVVSSPASQHIDLAADGHQISVFSKIHI
jgi:hypothetical protein